MFLSALMFHYIAKPAAKIDAPGLTTGTREGGGRLGSVQEVEGHERGQRREAQEVVSILPPSSESKAEKVMDLSFGDDGGDAGRVVRMWHQRLADKTWFPGAQSRRRCLLDTIQGQESCLWNTENVVFPRQRICLPDTKKLWLLDTKKLCLPDTKKL